MQPDLARLRVAFVVGTLGRGGAEQQLFYTVQSLTAEGVSVSVLSLTRGEFWERRIAEMGVTVIPVGERASRLARLARIGAEVRRLRPHIVQSQHFYTNLYATLAARRAGVRDIGAIRNDVISETRANGRLLGTLSLRMPRALIANSEAAVRNAVSLGVPERKLFFLPNVVDTGRFSPAERVERPVLRVLSAGRLARQKRHDIFLRCFADARSNTGQKLHAIIAGEGPLRRELEQLAVSLGLEGSLEFAGSVENMVGLYRRSDILALTSDHEGTPNVVLEAMSCGLAVLATATGGVPALIRDGETGMLAAPGDEGTLGEKLQRLIADPDLRKRLGGRAREFVEARHSIRSMTNRLAPIYRQALAHLDAGEVRNVDGGLKATFPDSSTARRR